VSGGLLHHLVKDSAARSPGAPAVHAGTECLSYRELDQLADQQADGLAEAGVRPGDRVVIWAAKSTATVALTQAALRIGAIYVPVAPANPISRVRRICASCSPRLIVTDGDGLAAAGELEPGIEVATLDTLAAAGSRRRGRPGQAGYPAMVSQHAPAYILYTSGSTGDPKGVLISHRNALAFVSWAAGVTGLRSADRLANHASFNFDLSVFDLYGAFLAGASVDLIPAELAYSAAELTAYLHDRKISVWYSVPSALLLMMRYGGLLGRTAPDALRVCVFAGEPFPIAEVRRLRAAWPGVRLLNWYGPTETNVCTSYEVTDADLASLQALPIGSACSGDTVTLDPQGAPEGEIVVSGPTVMLGYWGQPPLEGTYRTGDVGRYRPDGSLEYVGRRDSLVKLRGHRVELGEVEAVLACHPSVLEAAVTVTGAGIDARLRAIVVTRPDTQLSLLKLKAHCAARLPAYMIIDELLITGALPRNENGKLDRRALAALAAPAGQPAASGRRPVTGRTTT
jgi:clorobiocin biosynthesis protein CloN4